jgi:superfamily I DNA/RNA helicase
MMMLKMLLNDTTIPKIFVGDPKQSIYQWRGCINGFDYMPKDALIIEFYSTFRVGDPACEKIRQMFDDCWMISKSKNKTEIHTNIDIIKDEKYTYLFRSWRQLLTTAQTMTQMYIHGYDSKIETIRKLHNVLSSFGSSVDEEEFEDDLPKFLKSISKSDLECLISRIDENITTKELSKCKLYTIHAYKGLEDDNIRIANDIDTTEKVDENLHYVALTRGIKYIVSDNSAAVSTIQTKISNMFV